MKVVHYPRVSSIKQLREGDSIPAQKQLLDTHSKNANDEVISTIIDDEGKTGAISDEEIGIEIKDDKLIATFNLNKRKGFQQIIQWANEGSFEALKFTRWDRYSRNPIFSQLTRIYFERKNIKLIPIQDTTDSLLIQIKSILSQEEVNKIKERVHDTRHHRFTKGIMVSKAPYGYTPIKHDKKITGFKPHPIQSQTVQNIFQKTIQDESYKTICAHYNLKPQSYYNIIRNKTYYGIITYQKKETTGNHTPLITKETYDKANKKIRGGDKT